MFVEAVGVEPTKAEWQQIYSLPSLTAGAHLNFFVFLWKQLESNQFLRIFSPSHRPPLLCFHFFLLPHKDSNLDNNGSEPFALPLCYKAIIAESHGFEPYALTRTFCLANKSVSLTVALSIYWRKGESTIPSRFTDPIVFKTTLAYHTSYLSFFYSFLSWFFMKSIISDFLHGIPFLTHHFLIELSLTP